MRFAFIAKNAGMLPVERLCQIMDVSPRWYRAYRNRPLSQSRRKDMVVLAHIREQFALSLGSYGRPRMTEELKELGLEVGHRRVGRLMSENGIEVKRNKKFKATTDRNHAFNIAPNLLNRDFHAPSRQICFANRLPGNGCAQSEMGWRHQLCVDPRRLALPGRHP
jgi:hypothetical protein